MTDTAEGLLDVPAIAQRLKRWSVDVYTVGDAEIVFEVDEPS